MTSIERGQSVSQASTVPVKTQAEAVAVQLASRLTAALDRAGAGDAVEVGRILVELERLPEEAQKAFFAAAGQGLVGRNAIDAVRDRINEKFPVGSEKRLRLAEVLARAHGVDPRAVSRTALEAIVTRVLSRLGPIAAGLRPAAAPPRDEMLPGLDLGPFAPAPAPSAVVSALAAATGASAAQVSQALTILDVTIPTITPSSPPPKPKKKGFLGKLLSIVSIVLTILSFIFPIYAVIFKMIQAAIAAYQAIKAKNIMGAVGAVASAFGAAGAQALGQVAGVSAQALSKISEFAGGVMKALQAYQAARKGDWVGALAGIGAAAAGFAQSTTGAAAEALKGFATKMQEISARLSTVVQVVQAARKGDFIGAIGLGASLATDLKLIEPEVTQALKQALQPIAGLVEKFFAVQTAIRQGDYVAAASGIAGIVGMMPASPARERLQVFARVLERAAEVQRLVKKRDYEGAARALGEIVRIYEGSAETKARMTQAAQQLQLVARAFARGRAGDWIGAGAEISRMVSAFEWDNETRARLLKTSSALRRASEIPRSLKAGRYEEAVAVLTDALSVLTGETPDLARVVRQLEESGRLYQAMKQGDYERALRLFKEIIEREVRRPPSEQRPRAASNDGAGAPPRQLEAESGRGTAAAGR